MHGFGSQPFPDGPRGPRFTPGAQDPDEYTSSGGRIMEPVVLGVKPRLILSKEVNLVKEAQPNTVFEEPLLGQPGSDTNAVRISPTEHEYVFVKFSEPIQGGTSLVAMMFGGISVESTDTMNPLTYASTGPFRWARMVPIGLDQNGNALDWDPKTMTWNNMPVGPFGDDITALNKGWRAPLPSASLPEGILFVLDSGLSNQMAFIEPSSAESIIYGLMLYCGSPPEQSGAAKVTVGKIKQIYAFK